MYFSHQRENEVSKVAECQRGGSSCRSLRWHIVGTSVAGPNVQIVLSV